MSVCGRVEEFEEEAGDIKDGLHQAEESDRGSGVRGMGGGDEEGQQDVSESSPAPV